jgi:hypothetical protein
MTTPEPLPRAVALDPERSPRVPAALIGWAFLTACSIAAIDGWLALRAAEAGFSPFGLETFGLASVAKAAIYRLGTGITAGVLLAFAAGLLRARGPTFAGSSSRRWLALRVAGVFPVLAVVTIACVIGSAALFSGRASTVCEFLSSADLAPALIAVAVRAAITGTVLFVASPRLVKKAGIAVLVGKIALLWLVEGTLWFAATEVLWT